MKTKYNLFLTFLVIAMMVLAACGGTYTVKPDVLSNSLSWGGKVASSNTDESAVIVTDVPESAEVETESVTTQMARLPQLDVVTYTPPENAVPLISNDETIGFFFVLNKDGPAEVLSPHQSTTMISLGNGQVGETTVTSDGTEGNIVTILCNKPEGCVTPVTDFTPGHVGITLIFAGKEVPTETVLGAVVNMFNAPNCGGSGCKTIYHYQSGKKETFTAKPTSVSLAIPWEQVDTQTAIIGELPENAKVIKINKKVVGHAYTLSGENSVSVPEGAGGTILCFPDGGEIDGVKAQKGEILVFEGTPSDGFTPEDLNLTLLVAGNNVQVTMIYVANLDSFKNIACGQ